MTVTLMRGDCLDVMATLAENSVDTIITDPPYGLEFMSKDWDHGVPGIPFWTAALRVAKPGATLMAFGGTRTHHRLMCAIEDAGWELRDTMMYVYGSGFPKSLSISKALDKVAIVDCSECGGSGEVVVSTGDFEHSDLSAYTRELCGKCGGMGKVKGAEREVLGIAKGTGKQNPAWNGTAAGRKENSLKPEYPATAPATDAAQLWDGWGTALKPAWEPIIIAQKPRDGTFANNALEHGVAGLWIDGGRIENSGKTTARQRNLAIRGGNLIANRFETDGVMAGGHPQGRWPANLVHDGSDEVTALFPVTKTNGRGPTPANTERTEADSKIYGFATYKDMHKSGAHFGDSGSAARFFYTAKASRAERNAGCEAMEEKRGGGMQGTNDQTLLTGSGNQRNPFMQNHHPTVKPLALMRYLAKLTATPTGGIVLDPFMGSGTTGMAAVYEGRDFIGIELEPEYFEIATARIQHAIDEQDEPQQMTMGEL